MAGLKPCTCRILSLIPAPFFLILFTNTQTVREPLGTWKDREAARTLTAAAAGHSPHTDREFWSGSLFPRVAVSIWPALSTLKVFGKRPLPSEFSSSLCTYLGKLQKRLGLGDLSCVGGVDWESQASELPRFRALGYLLHKDSGPRG